MRSVGIIPARMGSTRFPGKPMALIHGMPMIGHCYFRTKMCNDLIETFVATCDKEIFDYIESIGGNAIMTSTKHDRASDRTAEAMIKAEKMLNMKIDVVVMVQGDEPMVTPQMISDSLNPFMKNENISVVNLMAEMTSIKEFEDPNEVKVVVDRNSNAIYFSREPIPSRKKGVENVLMLKQVCIIPFKRDYLIKFNQMPETELERVESVDMMRIIEHGEKVQMVMTTECSFSVDTEEDRMIVEKNMLNDELLKSYQ